MKTTVELADDLLVAAKKRAAELRKPLRSLLARHQSPRVRAPCRCARASRRMSRLVTAAADARGWGIGIPSLAEFWAIVTHPSAPGLRVHDPLG